LFKCAGQGVYFCTIKKPKDIPMPTQSPWKTAKKTTEILGITKKELFSMRDDGTFKLGTHYAAFPETRSRDSYRWNIPKVQRVLESLKSS